MSTYARSFGCIAQDRLYPADAPAPDRPGCDLRHRAVADVLRRLPDDVYDGLKKRKVSKQSFDWFIPPLGYQGLTYPFVPNWRPNPGKPERLGDSLLVHHARIIYLSPLLELGASRDRVVYVVVHEIAHVYRRHALHFFDEGRRAEREAYRAACEWGFQREADATEQLERAEEVQIPNDGIPQEAVELIGLVRRAGIGIGNCYLDGDEVCFEFQCVGSVEMFLKIAGAIYRVAAELPDDGTETEPWPRVMLLVFVPAADMAGLVARFTEYADRYLHH